MANANEKYAANFFRSLGYSDYATAGIVGNLSWESGGLNTTAINRGDGRDGSDSIGIAQWNSTRAQQLKQFAQARNTPVNDLNTQLAFVHYELQTTERPTYDRLMSAGSNAEGVQAFLGYERPQGYSASNPTGALHYQERLGRANAIATGGDTGTAGSAEGAAEAGSGTASGGAGGLGASSGSIPQAIDRATQGANATAAGAWGSTATFASDLFGRGALIVIGVIVLAAGLGWLVFNSKAAEVIPQVAAVKRAARKM